ncbi:MAG TPA: PD-(D/E)XK nuclease family protein, partial [Acidimicrobiia bacterium]|nr:PD-(D/E)XK nuclease family protein [Acidimicrobiia bacterium]
GHAVPAITDDGVVVSATRLQAYAFNPHDYFLEYVLRVDIPELPEERYEVSPMDRGSLVHEALDAFLAEVLARPGGAPAPDAAWTDADRKVMHDLAAARMTVYEAQGRTGRRLFWHRDRRRILAELDRFLEVDATVRAEWGLRPIATELRFGFADGALPVDLRLSDGRSVRFRGAADRVDVTDTGALWIVDYKTGNPNRYRVDGADPTAAGTMLQLPVYAHAARASFGAADTPVGAAYWLVSTRGRFELEEVELDDRVEARVDEVLRTIADGIGAGVFPCRVDPPSTWGRRYRSYIDPDARGTRDRYREWLRKRAAPELRGYVSLAEPDLIDEHLDEHVLEGSGS